MCNESNGLFFSYKRHPQEMGAAEVEAFLTHLAVDGHVSASTQNQALSALLFFVQGGVGDRFTVAEQWGAG